MTSTGDATRPLEGIRVLDLSRMFPGAYCTVMLADMGAEVLKLEGPGYGDGMRHVGDPKLFAHLALNRGKQSMTFNLKAERAAEVMRRLAADADVVVESARPGSLEKLGMGFEDLRADNPGLVWCSISGFGPDGPNRDNPGHDMTFLGYSGLLDTLAQDGVPPVTKSTITLQLAGMLGAFGIVAALNGRARTGRGCRVDANMVDAATWMIAENIVRAANEPAPAWPSFPTRANYRCADGKWITCTSSEPRSWAAAVEALDIPEFADYRAGSGDGDAVGARLTEVFATKPQAAWLESPGLAGGIGPVYEAEDLVDDPQLTSRHALVPLEGDGRLVLANPVRIDGALGDQGSHALGMAPELGQDTDTALARAGYSAEEIAELHEQGVV